MRHVFIAIASLFIIALSSCEYESDVIYERYLNKNVTPPNIEIVNLDFSTDKDTVELLYNRVYFNFKSPIQEILWVKFYINDSLAGTVKSGNGYFDLYCEFLYVGTHRLKLEIVTKSGTGSIAESLEAEGYVFATKEWVIKVNNTEYSHVTTTVSDGFLKLRWPEPYEAVAEYIIYRSNFEIGRTSTREFIDKGYVGEGAQYTVCYKSSYNGGLATLGWVRISNEIRFGFNYDLNNNYSIFWEQFKYYAAVDSIIVLSNDGHYGHDDVDKTTDINKRSFEIPRSKFGQLRKYRMVLTPKYSTPIYDPSKSPYSIFVSPISEYTIGYPSPIFDNFNRINSNEFLYHTSKYNHEGISFNDSMFRYSTTENKIFDRYRYNPPNYSWTGDHYWNPTISPDGNYSIAIAGLTNTAIISSSYSLNDYKIINTSNLTTGTDKIPISNIGTGIVCGSDKKYLYDFKNNFLLGYVSTTTWLSDWNISPDGTYFFLRVSHTIWLYSYTNNTIKLERTINAWTSPGFDYFGFIPNENDKAVSWSKSLKTFSILRYTDMSIIKSFLVSEDQILDIDYNTNRILSFSPNLLVIRSLVDGSVLYSIPVSFSAIFQNECFLSGNSIFHRNGARYFLN